MSKYQSEVCVVQNDNGDVLGVFWDQAEAAEVYRDRADVSFSKFEIWNAGEFSARRIRELVEEWEITTGYSILDHLPPGEIDWRTGLDRKGEKELERLLKWRKDNL